MSNVIVLIYLSLGQGFEYRTVGSEYVYKDYRSCEKELDRIELEERRKDKNEIHRFTKYTLRIDYGHSEDMKLYRCFPSTFIK
jgi:hypothetical protein